MMRRSILGLLYVIQGMRNSGIDVDTRLKEIGIQAQTLNPNSIIHDQLEWDILHAIGHDVPAEKGLEIGQHYALAGYGPLLMLLVTSDTLATAFRKGIRFQRLTHLFGDLEFQQDDHGLSLIYMPVDLNSHTGQLRAQCEVAGTYKFLIDIYKMMGLDHLSIKVALPFLSPQHLATLEKYKNYYGEDVTFNSPNAVFSLNHVAHEVKIPSVDMITHRLYETKCKQELCRLNKKARQTPELIQRVQDYLELQNGVIPTMSETAVALGIKERTLRHQLQQLNSSYKIIREQLIKEKALQLMEYKEYSIETIAELLGYSEPAAFNHAFKRWFGQSPRRYGK